MFRTLAAERDAALSQSFDLSRLWLELCRGTWRFRDTFPTENRYIALIEEPSVRFPQPLKACKLGVLKRVLLGETPKAVAIELRMGLSSVAAAIQDCLLGMGIPGRLSQASVLLTMAACAAHRPESSPTLGRLSRVEVNGEALLGGECRAARFRRFPCLFPMPRRRSCASWWLVAVTLKSRTCAQPRHARLPINWRPSFGSSVFRDAARSCTG